MQDFEKECLDGVRDDLIEEGVLTRDVSDWIETLIEYKIKRALENYDPRPYIY